MNTNIIKEDLEKYVNLSKKCELAQKEFLSNKQLVNVKTGEVKELDYNLQKEYQLMYNDLISKSIFFQKEFEKKYNGEFVALFITITANTQYHKYKQDNQGNLVNNPNYKGYTIQETYELINKVKRTFYNELTKKDKGRVKVDCRYLQVIEKHINLTPYLHLILFIPKEHLEYTINIIKRKMKSTDEKRVIVNDEDKKTIDKYIINSNYQKNISNDVGRCEIEILQDSKKITGYVSKYIKKQFKSDNLENIRELDGWKRKHKINLILTSRTPVPKYIYKIILSQLKDEDKIKFDDLFCDIQNNTTLIKKNIKTNKSKIKQSNNEIFKATVNYCNKEINKNELESEICIIKKLSERELNKILTKQEINPNLKIFDLFIKNTNIKEIKKIKDIVTINNFLVK